MTATPAGDRVRTFSDLVKRVLDDPAFRADLRRNPEKALKEAGVEATPAMIDALKAFSWKSAERVAKAFDLNIIT